ncbi:hypothetical protein HAX54_034225, partial [Datura stramonium]|nr:hypothetical protein [Datura stramonium]
MKPHVTAVEQALSRYMTNHLLSLDSAQANPHNGRDVKTAPSNAKEQEVSHEGGRRHDKNLRRSTRPLLLILAFEEGFEDGKYDKFISMLKKLS